MKQTYDLQIIFLNWDFYYWQKYLITNIVNKVSQWGSRMNERSMQYTEKIWKGLMSLTIFLSQDSSRTLALSSCSDVCSGQNLESLELYDYLTISVPMLITVFLL